MKKTESVEKNAKTTDRTWGKWFTEVKYSMTSWSSFVNQLYQHYAADDKLPALIDDPDLPRMLLAHCFVNLALIEQVEQETQEKAQLNGSTVTEAALERGDIYQTLLATGKYRGIDDLMGSLDNREMPTGWICITGRAGTGKTTLLQQIAYRWGMCQALWYNRFDFVFRIKLNLLGQPNFWDGVPGHSDVDYLSWLIYKSLGASVCFSFNNIRACLGKEVFHNRTLLLLDGFDEIRILYGEKKPGSDSRVTALIEKVFSFPNGILTSRPNAIPKRWIIEKRFKERFENIGLTRDNVCHYIRNYYEALSQPEMAKGLLSELYNNPEMMNLAQIPVNIAALCLTWENELKLETEQDTKKILTMTMLYRRVILWIIRRYDASYTTNEKMRTSETPDAVLLHHYKKTLKTISALAYDAFKSGEIQSLSHTLLSKHFPDSTLLHELCAHWGILRALPLPEREGEYARHYFIHLTYQEYFTALHIAEIFAEPENKKNREQEIKRRKAIQNMAIFVQEKKNDPRYTIIWIFLSGLLAIPEYAKGADYFWEEKREACTSVSDTIIGLHPSFQEFRTQQRLYQEALFTHNALKTSNIDNLPTHLSQLVFSIQPMTQWHAITRIKTLNPVWDKTEDDTKTAQTTRCMEERQSQQYAQIQQMLQWSTLPLITLPSLFSWVSERWERSVTETRSRLTDSDEDVRLSASNTLTKFGAMNAETLIFLQAALKNDDASIRCAAAEALEKFDVIDVNNLALLHAALKDSDLSVRYAVESTLKKFGEQNDEAVTAIRADLWNRNPHDRRDAVQALSSLGAKDANTLGALRRLLNDDVPFVFYEAAFALVRLGVQNVETLTVLRAALKADHESFRLTAVEVISNSKVNDDETLIALRAALREDSNKDIRRAAAEALGKIGAQNAEILRALRAALRDSNEYVRSAAVGAFGKIGVQDNKILPMLRSALRDSSLYVRSASAEVLGNIKANDTETLIALRVALRDSSEYVRASVISALGHIGAQDVETLCALRTVLKDSNNTLRNRAVYALGNIKANDTETLEALQAALKDSDRNVRRATVQTLGHIGTQDSETLTLLRAALKDSDNRVRSSAAYALGNIKANDAETLEALQAILMLKNNDSDVRIAAACALAIIGAQDAKTLEALQATLKDSNNWYSIHFAAASAFHLIASHIQNSAAFRLLWESAKDCGNNLEVLYTLNVALLRVPLLTYVSLPDLFTNTKLQKYFLLSLWLKGSSISMDIINKTIVLNGEAVVCDITDAVFHTFIQTMQAHQADFMGMMSGISPDYAPILSVLTQPIDNRFSSVSVFAPDFLTDGLPLVKEEPTLRLLHVLTERLSAFEIRFNSAETLTIEQRRELERLGADLRDAQNDVLSLQQQAGTLVTETDFDPMVTEVRDLQARLARLELPKGVASQLGGDIFTVPVATTSETGLALPELVGPTQIAANSRAWPNRAYP